MVSRLFRPAADRMIGGVCSGLGLYFGLDPVIVRLLFVVLAFTTGLTLILYPILWIVMPSGAQGPVLPPGARFDPQTGEPLPPDFGAPPEVVRPVGHQPVPAPIVSAGSRNRVFALVLLGVGALVLIDNIGEVFGFDLESFAIPLLLVGLGLYLLRGTKAGEPR